MARGDWVSFSFLSKSIEICDGLPTSIKKCKIKFFFVDAFAFGLPMQFESRLNRDHDSNPELTIDEQSTVDPLVANYVKWYDPNDSTLELPICHRHTSCYGSPWPIQHAPLMHSLEA
ncbi:unnamed protein product [Lactuca virosa]|uniref:Uncharacterized protein n=1 Tax=Lactuca virosa TaxID=75947 RepID=A0AAU9LHL7_9ASTR|nr:unnamed protein product [Lactuca virosa]